MTIDTALADALHDAPDAQKCLKKAIPKKADQGPALFALVGSGALDPFTARDAPHLLWVLAESAAKAPFDDVRAFFERLRPEHVAFSEIRSCAASYKKNKKAWDAALPSLPLPAQVVIAIGRADGGPVSLREDVQPILDALADAAARNVGLGHVEVAVSLGDTADAFLQRVAARITPPLDWQVLQSLVVKDALRHAPWAVVKHVLTDHPTVNVDAQLLARTDPMEEVLSALGERANDWRRAKLVLGLAASQQATVPESYDEVIVQALLAGVDDLDFVRGLACIPAQRLEALAQRALDSGEAKHQFGSFAALRHLDSPSLMVRARELLTRRVAGNDFHFKAVIEALAVAGRRGAAILLEERERVSGSSRGEARERLALQAGLFRAARYEAPASVEPLLPNADLAFLDGMSLFESWQETRAMLSGLPPAERERLVRAWEIADWDDRLDVRTRFDAEPRLVDVMSAPWEQVEEVFAWTDRQRMNLRVLGRTDVPLERREQLLERLLGRPDTEELRPLFSAVVAQAYRELGDEHFAEGTAWDRAICLGLPVVDHTTVAWYFERPRASAERWAAVLEGAGKPELAAEIRQKAKG